MKRTAALTYAVFCYVIFFAVFLYAIGFVGNVFVPTSLDGAPRTTFLEALCTNILLLALFAVQHSGMARPTFKRWWTKIVPEPVERATYVLFSNAAMILIFAFWQPVGGVVWDISNSAARATMFVLFGLGWAVVFYATCLLNHFELFGLRQAWLYFRGRGYRPLPFSEPGLYRYVRHPLYVGWLMAVWFTPTMTASHLFFAIGVTAYILIAIRLEERNLVDALPGYRDYKVRVPMLVPRVMVGTSATRGHAV